MKTISLLVFAGALCVGTSEYGVARPSPRVFDPVPGVRYAPSYLGANFGRPDFGLDERPSRIGRTGAVRYKIPYKRYRNYNRKIPYKRYRNYNRKIPYKRYRNYN
eukprot:CAMPEP_0203779988 /NCGR_PEP_ID=MMETSP0099_2-20121227/9096_1 /ASSEMBLY_ACC=CAM_ASM_000209 /TAXON_ID=96639 /ORGANISM=" , Strain NY0313808BC1" /LENGTH=104 /DNA_ID=CAMNT_0050680145 /DNA_START=1054 /DNA_END=1365 /DNA_ORIENTATION=+